MVPPCCNYNERRTRISTGKDHFIENSLHSPENCASFSSVRAPIPEPKMGASPVARISTRLSVSEWFKPAESPAALADGP